MYPNRHVDFYAFISTGLKFSYVMHQRETWTVLYLLLSCLLFSTRPLSSLFLSPQSKSASLVRKCDTSETLRNWTPRVCVVLHSSIYSLFGEDRKKEFACECVCPALCVYMPIKVEGPVCFVFLLILLKRVDGSMLPPLLFENALFFIFT